MVSAWLRAALLGASLAVQPATVVPAAQWTQAAQNLTSQAAAAAASSGCTGASDCRVGQYCDFRHVCYNCSYLSAKCDAVDLDCCSDVFVSRCPSDPLHCHRRVPPIVGCGSPAAPGGSAAACVAALTTACGAERPDVFKCAQCAGAHQAQLHAAGCSNDNISLWCSTGGGDSTSSSSGAAAAAAGTQGFICYGRGQPRRKSSTVVTTLWRQTTARHSLHPGGYLSCLPPLARIRIADRCGV